MTILNQDLENLTRDELESIENFEVVTEESLIERCHDYLDDSLIYIPISIIGMFADDDIIREYHESSYEGYIEDIKWETEEYKSNRINTEMAEWGAETEEEFLGMLVEQAMSEGCEYFTFNFGNEEGIKFLIALNAIDVEALKEYIIDTDGFEDVLGLEIHEVELDGETLYLVEE